jgi:hypothetical protein
LVFTAVKRGVDEQCAANQGRVPVHAPPLAFLLLLLVLLLLLLKLPACRIFHRRVDEQCATNGAAPVGVVAPLQGRQEAKWPRNLGLC